MGCCLSCVYLNIIQRLDGDLLSIEKLCLPAEEPVLLKDCMVDGIWGDVWVKALGEDEYLFLFGTARVEYLGQLYRKRWMIETLFQTLKERGFNLEKTHLKDFSKLKKLVALVSIAYGVCISLGIYIHNKVQKIKMKKHGYKAKSFARKGIDYIREMFRGEQALPEKILMRIQALFRWVFIQASHYHYLKKVG
jgi:hypothetical protein